MKHKRPPIPVIIVVVVLLAGLGGWWWSATRPAPDAGLTLSGQVETDEIAVAPAMAGRITIAQVETLVQPGEIDPGSVHLPGVFVQRVVHTGPQDKRIEKRTVRTDEEAKR